MDVIPASRDARCRVLVADDDAQHNEMLAWRLRYEGFEVLTAQCGEECLEYLSQQDFDLVLLDLHLGDRSGIDLLTTIRKTRSATTLPVIMITGDSGGETTVRALQEGANDYVTKPVDFDVVIARLRTHLAFKTENEQLQRRALYDPLTGLPNRGLLADRLNAAFARGQRSKGSIALMLLDLDGFKAVNDRYGHVTGDKLLIAVAERLSETGRKSDTVGRLGGDEFLIIVEGLHSDAETKIIATRIEDAIQHPFEIDGQEIQIGISIGIHFWRAGDPADFGILLNSADAAMYGVKRTRKNVQSR